MDSKVDCVGHNAMFKVERVLRTRCQNYAPLCGGKINIVFGEADPPAALLETLKVERVVPNALAKIMRLWRFD